MVDTLLEIFLGVEISATLVCVCQDDLLILKLPTFVQTHAAKRFQAASKH